MEITFKTPIETINDNFKNDVDLGLSSASKFLLSKYFYDEKGDALFVEIMNMPEYYLTDAEYDIIKNKTQDLISALRIDTHIDFDLIELGAGDGTKTKESLKALHRQGFNFTYIPVDISLNSLNQLENSIKLELPNITLNTKQGDYFDVLKEIKTYHKPKVILF